MPRAGLDSASVTAATAALADEAGFAELGMGLLAARLGVRAPSLYKHVTGLPELQRHVAALAMQQAADAVGVAVQGLAGKDALAAAAAAFRDFVVAHPGRYAATLGIEPRADDDPVAIGAARLLAVLRDVLRAYPIADDDMTHALRTLRSLLHGFATLQSTNGFQWATDVGASWDWAIDLLDRGLRGADRSAR